MGAADDIKKGLTKNLANFTKQRKAEENTSAPAAGAHRGCERCAASIRPKPPTR